MKKKKKPQGDVTRMSMQGIITRPDAISNHQQLHIPGCPRSQCFVLQSSFSLGVKLHQIQSLLIESHTLFKNPIHLLVQLLRISLSHHRVKTLKLIVSREKIQFQVLENHLAWMTQMELIHFFLFLVFGVSHFIKEVFSQFSFHITDQHNFQCILCVLE